MARAKKGVEETSIILDSSQFEAAEESIANKLDEAFERVITKEFGFARAPKPYVTPFGIAHLDALLGGGIISSAPVVLSSTPETGKSTLAFQFSKIFQMAYPNSVIVYLDVEAAGNTTSISNGMSRIETFGVNTNRFRYEPVIIDVYGLFQMMETLVNIKRTFEEQLKKEFRIMIIWDSIAATSCSKVAEVEDPNKMIGVKARQLSFCIDKYAPIFAHNRITFLTVDQVRANLQIDGPYVAKEKSVGVWNDFRAASSVAAFNHKTAQWLFLSRREAITPQDGMGITGWKMNIYTEKNKISPSQESVTCIFDKRTGLHKFWSEFEFLSEMTKSEKKYFKEESKLPYPLSVKKSGNQVYLDYIDPSTGNSLYKSEKFFRKNANNLYASDENFKTAFDGIMSVAVEQRITQGLFRMISSGEISPVVVEEEIVPPNGDVFEQPHVYKIDKDMSFQGVAPGAKIEVDEGQATYESAFDEK